MRRERVDLVGGIALVVVSLVLGVLSLVLFDLGRPGAPVSPESMPEYSAAEIHVYVPADVDVLVSVTYRPVGDKGGDQTVRVLPRGRSIDREPFLTFIELRGSAQLDATTRSGALFDLPATQVELPPVPSPEPGEQDVVERRQMFLVQHEPGSFLRIPSASGNARIAALQTDNSRSTLNTAAIVLKKCRNLPRTTAEVSGPDGIEVERLSWLADFYERPGSCNPDEADYRGNDLGTVAIASSDGTKRSIRIDYAKPEATTTPPTSYSPTIDWTWEPHWAGVGAFGVRANFVDINEESRGQSMVFLSGVLIGLATAFAPPGIALVSRPWLTRSAGPPDTAG